MKFQLANSEIMNFVITVTDIRGQVIENNQVSVNSNLIEYHFNTELSSGTYFITVQTTKEVNQFKYIVR